MSKLRAWLEAEKTGRVISGIGERAKTSVTCRIDRLHLRMLEKLATATGRTRTACAEQILELAIVDAWRAWFGVDPLPAEVAQMEAEATEMQMQEYWILVDQARRRAIQVFTDEGDEASGRMLVEAKV